MHEEKSFQRQPRIHVFSGPTLDPGEARRSQPNVVAHGPVKHGDLFDPAIGRDDAVLIVDGLFHQSRALRHKEILHVLHRGVGVYGASSIGALRAVELRDHGMAGLGEVYLQYARGEIEGDDEVAVAQSPSGDQRALSVPMVNVRAMLRRAVEEGVLADPAARRHAELFRAIYYPQRTLVTMREVSQQAEGAAFVDWLTGRLREDPHFCDLKRADALLAIDQVSRRLRTGDRSRPRPPRSDREWRTAFYRDWVNHFARDAADPDIPARLRVRYQQIFDPGFPSVWTDYLHRLSETPADGSPPLPLAKRMEGFHRDAGALRATDVFRPRLDLGRPESLRLLLRHETADDKARIRSCLAENASFATRRPGLSHHLMRGSVTAKLLSDIWRIQEDGLRHEAARRGFRSTEEAVEAFREFVLGHCSMIRTALSS
ncbi:TfuA-like protein [Streptosporangium carneum]|uniref:TfuA-like core domain-containing protein n=1 Tax=Streptosporangium carneum TaxID=47481 RepID=A0A9W6IBD7_9ACTN|nr:TfuA-like protein [Streptosporangium carneum]GLK14931.1 hypothetical protein GCM10017600_83440 [Streptosporangium carneum]